MDALNTFRHDSFSDAGHNTRAVTRLLFMFTVKFQTALLLILSTRLLPSKFLSSCCKLSHAL